MSRRTTFQRAASGYDPDFENTLVDAIAAAVGEVSMVTDADCIAIRAAETASALVRRGLGHKPGGIALADRRAA